LDRSAKARRDEASRGSHGLGAALLGALDDDAMAQFAERLRPHLGGQGQDEELLTPAEAAARLKLHPKTVVRMAREGRIPAVKVGTGWRFHSDRLDIAARSLTPGTGAWCSTTRRAAGTERPSVIAIRGDRSAMRGRSA
jgi:excisionase family DNA binding protein